jgi:AMMECR1 domain-containing protein
VDSVEEQLRIAKMKAGLAPDEPCKLYRFTVERHGEG